MKGGIFVIEETILNEKIIQKIGKEIFSIEIFQISKLNRGSANLYSLNNKSYILKEFQTKYSRVEIEKEIKIINHLKKDGISVPEYVTTIDNLYSFEYRNHIITLQKYIDGYTIESNTASHEQLLDAAKVLGQIVRSLEKIDFELPYIDISNWYSPETLEEGKMKIENLINQVKGKNKKLILKDLHDKISMIEYVENEINLEEMKNLSCMNTHGDYSLMQFIYKEEKIAAVIDFVSACKMPVVWEVIRSYSYMDKDAKNGIININNLIDYVKEFTKYISLNQYDIRYMPYLYLIQLVTSTYGYKQYINDNTKKELLEFGKFRTNLCRNLLENAKIISSLLEESIK